ncbi:hypothetical protein [Massilia phosphatilytica]
MIVTTERRPQGQSHITDIKETLQRLSEGHLLHEIQAKNAIGFQAQEWGQQDDVADIVQRQNETLAGGTGKFPEFEDPTSCLGKRCRDRHGNCPDYPHVQRATYRSNRETGHIVRSRR